MRAYKLKKKRRCYKAKLTLFAVYKSQNSITSSVFKHWLESTFRKIAALFTLVKGKIYEKNIIYNNYSYNLLIYLQCKSWELNNVKSFLYKTYRIDSYSFIK